MRPRIWRLDNEQDKEGAIRAIREAVLGLWVTLGHPTRTSPRTRYVRASLTAFARQVQVDPGNGKELVDASDWKKS